MKCSRLKNYSEVNKSLKTFEKNKKKVYLNRYIAMHKTIIATLIFFIALISACHKKALVRSSKKKDTVVVASNVASEIKNMIIDPEYTILNTGTAYIIDSAKVNGDILSIFVNYSGGCKTHSFDLYSNGAYGKSLPPQISVSLKHNGNEDACRQLITQELKFNISKLKYQGQNTVIVDLGNKHRIYYVTQ